MTAGQITIAIVDSDRPDSSFVVRVRPIDVSGEAKDLVIGPESPATIAGLVPGLYAFQLLLPNGELRQEVLRVEPDAAHQVIFTLSDGVISPEHPEPFEFYRTSFDFAVLRQDRPAQRKGDATTVAGCLLDCALDLETLAGLDIKGVLALAGKPLSPRFRTRRGVEFVFDGNAPAAKSAPWVRVETLAAVELVRLPLPWRWERPDGPPRTTSVSMYVDANGGHASAATSITVNDRRLTGLLAYLDRGRLDVARPILQALEDGGLIEETIREKTGNPLAACAAAYTGLAIFAPGEQERWDVWLPNLMNWFPAIPDGAIVHARRIDLRPGVDGRAGLIEALNEALKRGAPVFSAGFEVLETLWRGLGPKAGTSEPMTALMQVASRVDRYQTFTVLRFPKGLAHAP